MRVFLLIFFTLAGVAAGPAVPEAAVYRFVDETGTVHFTDDIQQVPEAQRPKALHEKKDEDRERETDRGQKVKGPLDPPGPSDKKKASLKDEAEALFLEKEALEEEFRQIIEERDRLQRERSTPGGPAEVKAYNDAVFALKRRIAEYQKRCDAYEARRKALHEKMDALTTP